MSRRSEEQVLLRNYLLGDLDEVARERVEQRLLGDDDFAERLSEAEAALIDDYVFDALPAGERKSFDENFVTDEERRRKILFARTLEIYVEERHGPRPPAREDSRPEPPRKNPLPFIQAHKTWSAVSALLILLLLASPALLWWLRPTDKRAVADRRMAEVNKRPFARSVQDLPALELALQDNLLREGGGMQRAVLADDIKLLTLKLAPPRKSYENYSARVLTVGDDELFAVDGLTPQVDAGVETIPLNIPAEFLPTDDYQIQLRGRDADGNPVEVGRYKFRVINEK